MSHTVAHGEHAAGSYGCGPPSAQVQVAVMLRADVSRAARARTVNATPGPAELFEIVNSATARHLADLPDLAAVIAESREAGQDRSVKARGCISQASPTLPSHVQAARRGTQKLTRGRKTEKRDRERERKRRVLSNNNNIF